MKFSKIFFSECRSWKKKIVFVFFFQIRKDFTLDYTPAWICQILFKALASSLLHYSILSLQLLPLNSIWFSFLAQEYADGLSRLAIMSQSLCFSGLLAATTLAISMSCFTWSYIWTDLTHDSACGTDIHAQMNPYIIFCQAMF